MHLCICRGCSVMRPKPWCSRVALVVRRDMCMSVQNDVSLAALIDAMNVELEAGNWANVVLLSTELYASAVAAGETILAELVQDLHWIANDALVHPLEVAVLVQP